MEDCQHEWTFRPTFVEGFRVFGCEKCGFEMGMPESLLQFISGEALYQNLSWWGIKRRFSEIFDDIYSMTMIWLDDMKPSRVRARRR